MNVVRADLRTRQRMPDGSRALTLERALDSDLPAGFKLSGS